MSFLSRNPALGFPLFRKYLLLRFLIVLALNMQLTVIAYLVYELTNDVVSLGRLGLCEAIPAIGCSLFSGYFVDRTEKKKLLLICLSGYILLALGFSVLASGAFRAWAGVQTTVYLIYGGMLAGGVLRAFLSPSFFSLMGLLVPRQLYANASTWSSTCWQLGAVFGPLLGGLIFGYLGQQAGLWTVAGLQLLALAPLLAIPAQKVFVQHKEAVLKSLREGLKFVFSTQIILAALALDMFAVLFGGAIALLPVFARDILEVGTLGYGWLRAAPGIGALVVLMILSFKPVKTRAGLKMLACIAGYGLTIIIFGLSENFVLSFAMLLAGGIFDGVSVVIRSTILQLYTPDHMRGRVAAVNTMFVSSSNELGEVESCYTARWMGTVPAVLFGGCMTLLVVGLTWLRAPVLRALKLESRDERADD